jgi:hypothetical protein
MIPGNPILIFANFGSHPSRMKNRLLLALIPGTCFIAALQAGPPLTGIHPPTTPSARRDRGESIYNEMIFNLIDSFRSIFAGGERGLPATHGNGLPLGLINHW